ncbi:MAG: SIS domain-containing protein [Dongiaceae bacterium]
MSDDLFERELAEHRKVAEAVHRELAVPFAAMRALWSKTIRGGGKILFFGNGGSAGDSQHLATELAIRYSRDRKAIAAIALTTDSSALTAAGNDLGFERIFARQVEAIGRAGDLAFGITTSGRSPNVLAALKTARGMGLATAGLTGNGPHQLGELCDCLLTVPSTVTARIQEMHITLGQMLCAALEADLGLV